MNNNLMKMRRKILLTSVASAILLSNAALAQDTSTTNDATEEDAEDLSVEEITVTGSRLRRNAFTSISPIQVIGGEISRELGFFDATDLLQSQTQTTGLQINNTFNNFVLDNGVGAATLAFRGLGPDRTLILVNDRRLAPAGVGGAPGVPDTNLIPNVLIARIENLFDGASTTYGSDAVAGVSNIKLKSNVEGFEFEASTNLPEAGGAESFTIGALYGDRGENWHFTVAAEYFDRKAQSFGQNPFFAGCNEVLFEGPDGERFTENQSAFTGSRIPGNGASSCNTQASSRIIIPFFGSVYFTENFSNIGIPNFSEVTLANSNAGFFDPAIQLPYDSNGDGIIDENDRFAFDGNGDGRVDVSFLNPQYDFGITERAQSGDFLAGLERKSIYAEGAYGFDDENETEVYGEVSYAKRDSVQFAPGSSIFPVVSADNPFNPVGTAGVDVFNSLIGGFVRGPSTAQPVLRVLGDRDERVAEVEQYRIVGGVRGNAGFLDNFLAGNWSYDFYGSHSRSTGNEVTVGLDAERFNLSLDTTIEDPNNPGSFICGADGDGDGIPDGTDGCVPINLFAPSLYAAEGGTFATQAEADYLFVDRTFRTIVEQTIVAGSIQGDLFEIPWTGETLPLFIGAEWRRDAIDSTGNDIATQGGLVNFFSDQGARGSRRIWEVFAETELTLLQDLPLIKSLNVSAAGRLTDEEFSPLAGTYSFKAKWDITEWFALRGTYGTSYRTPNLRERFLLGTTGFINVFDPCAVPTDARISDPTGQDSTETYDPNGDEREQRVITSCQNNGLDPFSVGLDDGSGNGFFPTSSTEVSSGGTVVSNEERSRSYTIGAVFDQNFTDAFDLRLSATYYNIRITDGISEPGGNFIVTQCFNNEQAPDGSSESCQFISRDANNQIDLVTTPFINVGLETAKGIDFNAFFRTRFSAFGEDFQLTIDTTANYVDEQFFDILGIQDDNAGEIQQPRWRANGTANIRWKDLSVTWSTRWIQGANVDNPTGFSNDAVACPNIGQLCRPVSFTTNYDVHTLSVSYNLTDKILLNGGVRNIFDTAPPRVSNFDIFAVNNNPIGVGYDNVGRSFFFTVRAQF